MANEIYQIFLAIISSASVVGIPGYLYEALFPMPFEVYEYKNNFAHSNPTLDIYEGFEVGLLTMCLFLLRNVKAEYNVNKEVSIFFLISVI